MVSGKVDNQREEKKIEQPHGKLLRRKILRRKRPLPTATSPLPYEGNRRISSQNQISSKPSPNRLPNKYSGQQFQNSSFGHYELKVKQKVRRKKIPVVLPAGPSSSKVITYKPQTTPMVSGNLSGWDEANALNRTTDDKRCKYLQDSLACNKLYPSTSLML